MEERTCTLPDCERLLSARGLCNRHYLAARKAGVLPEYSHPRHAMSNVDREDLVADCLQCGPGVTITITKRGVARCIKGAADGRAKGHRQERAKRTAEQRRSDRLRWEYGITHKQYELMYQALGGCCEICRARQDTLYIDHDHLTGVVRGLLCHRCNVGIGWFKDSPRLTFSATKYLRRTTGLIF